MVSIHFEGIWAAFSRWTATSWSRLILSEFHTSHYPLVHAKDHTHSGSFQATQSFMISRFRRHMWRLYPIKCVHPASQTRQCDAVARGEIRWLEPPHRHLVTYSRSLKNLARRLLHHSHKSASATPWRPICQSGATVGVRGFCENGCSARAHSTTSPPSSETPNGLCHVCLRGGRSAAPQFSHPRGPSAVLELSKTAATWSRN